MSIAAFKLDSTYDTVGSGTGWTSMHKELAAPIILDPREEYKISLRTSIPFNVPTVTAAIGNNTMRFDLGTGWRVITIQDGSYDVDAIGEAIHLELFKLGLYTATAGTYDPKGFLYPINLYFNVNTQRTEMRNVPTATHDLAATNGFIIDLSNNGTSTLYKTLGWTLATAVLVGSNYYHGSTDPDLFGTALGAFHISTDLVDNQTSTTSGGSIDHIIYSSVWMTTPGRFQSVPREGETPIYLKLKKSQIFSIDVRVLDSAGHLHTPAGTAGDLKVIMWFLIEKI